MSLGRSLNNIRDAENISSSVTLDEIAMYIANMFDESWNESSFFLYYVMSILPGVSETARSYVCDRLRSRGASQTILQTLKVNH